MVAHAPLHTETGMCACRRVRIVTSRDGWGKVANIEILVHVASIDIAIGSTEGGDGKDSEKNGRKMHDCCNNKGVVAELKGLGVERKDRFTEQQDTIIEQKYLLI